MPKHNKYTLDIVNAMDTLSDRFPSSKNVTKTKVFK